MMLRRFPLFLILPLLASCVAPTGPVPPAPRPAPAATPRPATPVPPVLADRYAGDWSTADTTPGDWRYAAEGRGSITRFTSGNGPVLASISCAGGQITLSRAGVIPADMAAMINVRNSFAERALPIRSAADRMLSATLDARDPLWDQIIYSRGRFLVEATRQAPVILPARPEIARVVEDCRR